MWESSSSHPMFIPSYVRWPVIDLIFLYLYFVIIFFYFTLMMIFMISWSNDLQMESNEGSMTLRVQKTMMNGFKVFLMSEIMVFFSLIWSFGLVPNIWLLSKFPPYGMVSMYPFGMPLMNCLMLLGSSLPLQSMLMFIKFATHLSHEFVEMMTQTIAMAGLFLFFQMKEYTTAFFTLSDSMYGTVFYTLTGLHGLHVMFAVLGFMLLWYNVMTDKMYKELHLYLKVWSYYWHLVDIIWMVMFNSFYLSI